MIDLNSATSIIIINVNGLIYHLKDKNGWSGVRNNNHAPTVFHA